MCLMVFPWPWLSWSGTLRRQVPCCRAPMRKCPPVVSAGGSAVTAVRVAVEAAGREPGARRICNDYLITTHMAMTCHFAAENRPPTAIVNTQPIAELVLLLFSSGHVYVHLNEFHSTFIFTFIFLASFCPPSHSVLFWFSFFLSYPL